MDVSGVEPTLLEMVETMVRAGSMQMKHLGPDWQQSKVTGVGGHLLPCAYDAWATNTYPVFPRLQDVLAGHHPDVEALIRQAYAVGADLGLEKKTHVRVFSVDHPVQKPLVANHEDILVELL